MADAFPDAKAGWVEQQDDERWNVLASENFTAQNQWICENSSFDLMSFADVQLGRGGFGEGALDGTRRRLTLDENSKTGVLAYRTFRIDFSYEELGKQVYLKNIRSGYTVEELAEGSPDKYGDKELHRKFLELFAYN